MQVTMLDLVLIDYFEADPGGRNGRSGGAHREMGTSPVLL